MRNLYRRITIKRHYDSEDGNPPDVRVVGEYVAQVLPPSRSSAQLGVLRNQDVRHTVILPLGSCPDVRSDSICVDGVDYRILERRQTLEHEILEVGYER
jgi:hypothetical protein